MKLYRRTQFGNPVLRTVARQLTSNEIMSDEVQTLIKDMKYTLKKRQYGVGLAAPQIGKSISLAIIGIKPTPTRPDVESANLCLINPLIVSRYGRRQAMWEGCISGPELYGKALRYQKIRLKWLNERGKTQEKDFEGLTSQVIQHEVDHLSGILFVERVKDPKSYVTFSEYKKLKKAGMNKP